MPALLKIGGQRLLLPSGDQVGAENLIRQKEEYQGAEGQERLSDSPKGGGTRLIGATIGQPWVLGPDDGWRLFQGNQIDFLLLEFYTVLLRTVVDTRPSKSKLKAGGVSRLNGKRRRLTAKVASIAGLLACVVGAGLLLYPYYTDYTANQAQQSLAKNFDRREVEIAYGTKEIPISSPVMRLKIQKLGVETIVVEGTTEEPASSWSSEVSAAQQLRSVVVYRHA